MDKDQERIVAWTEQRRRKLSAAAATVLSKTHSSADLIRLMALLNNRDPQVREGAVRHLAQIGSRDAAALLARRARDGDPHVRAAVCRALGHLRAHQHKHLLSDSLFDSSPLVVCAAAEALAQMGDRSGLAPITQLVRTPGPHRWDALRTLNRITGQNFPINEPGLRDVLAWIKYLNARS